MSNSTFMAAHASYDHRSGLFSAKSDAQTVAALVYNMMARRFNDFNPASIAVLGKGKTHWIEFPRLKKLWHPPKVHPADFASELADIATLFAEFYTPKEPK